ncbi:hypothetical protein FHW16_000295 [Phyllobacterium myrsinacearum]|uniref:Uncharacterized protein n=1 Tax=Phyllobacterium myrsinacearum TaxID=28101 RepID=A0A839E9T5_9HYPH|nr:hypothetical protein [Phyllobacterium myrsinacearum]
MMVIVKARSFTRIYRTTGRDLHTTGPTIAAGLPAVFGLLALVIAGLIFPLIS